MRRCARCDGPIDFEFDVLITLRRATYVHRHLYQCEDHGWLDPGEDSLLPLEIDHDLLDLDRDPRAIEWDTDWLPDDPLGEEKQ